MSKRVTTFFSLFCIALIAWFLAKATFALRETALDTRTQPPWGFRLPT